MNITADPHGDIHTLDVRQFPLHGSRLIEASAGTGKTYTIALLYVRLVLGHGGDNAFARPLMPPDILVMTFTDAATEELRDRIRARLAEAAAVFAGAMPVAEGDALADLLADYSESERPACALRLQRAAEWMDEAAVSTIHSWCQRMLREHAFDSGSLFQQTLVKDLGELIREVVQDYWREHFYPLVDAAQAAAVLDAFNGPDALQAALQPLLGKREAVLQFAGAPLPDAAQFHAVLAQAGAHVAVLQQWRQQRDVLEQQARDAWRQQADEVESLLGELQPSLNGTTHGSAKPEKFAALLAECRAWSEGAEAPKKLTTFSTGAFNFKKGKEQAQPAHPVFAQLAKLRAHDEAVPIAPTVPLAPFLLQHARQWVGRQLHAVLLRRAELGFDDLLHRLDVALQGDGGDAFAAVVRRQFPVALIDEFQDTDPVQYRMIDRIYRVEQSDRVEQSNRETALVMIGDPKQAIYAFRGADIHTYLRARTATAGRHYTLGKNFRSTTDVVAAVNQLFAQAEQHPRAAFRFREGENNPLPFVPVTAKGRSDCLRIDGERVPALTCWHQSPVAGGTVVNLGRYRNEMAAVSASEIVRWLNLARQQRAGFESADGRFTPLCPADIAILVRDGTEAEAIRAALRERDVASVYLSDRDSVFASAQAQDMMHWLHAVAQPGDDRRLRAALATTSLALPLAMLDEFTQNELAWEQEVLRFRHYRALWQRSGVLPMLRQMLNDFQVAARLLQTAGGERALTNLLHLAEWLQQASSHLDGEQALIRHLAEQIAQPTDEQILRLESDADLVKVITIHKSKGLEYPLVLLPFVCGWKEVDGRKSAISYRDEACGTVIEIGGKSLAADAYARADDERLAEDMRLLYVALTRARHALWLGVAPLAAGNSKNVQLHKGAFGYLLSGGAEMRAEDLPAHLLRAAGDGALLQCVAAPAATDDNYVPPPAPPLGDVRQMAGWRPQAWWIASYSALETGEHAALPVRASLAEPESARQATAGEEVLAEGSWLSEPVPAAASGLHAFPRGPQPGTFLHGILEWSAQAGFATAADDAPSRQAQLQRRCASARLDSWQPMLDAWLQALLVTPLPAAVHALRLVDIARCQPELEFWFASHQVNTRMLDALVTAQTLSAAPRPQLLPNTLHGMLKGFIDLVFEYEGRYYVADWKSNWLGESAEAYSVHNMRAAILEKRYELQYTLYLLALHRHLKNRLPHYDYDRDVGGALYVFLRGIDNPETRGVHFEKPPRQLIETLDALFAGQGVGHALDAAGTTPFAGESS